MSNMATPPHTHSKPLGKTRRMTRNWLSLNQAQVEKCWSYLSCCFLLRRFQMETPRARPRGSQGFKERTFCVCALGGTLCHLRHEGLKNRRCALENGWQMIEPSEPGPCLLVIWIGGLVFRSGFSFTLQEPGVRIPKPPIQTTN